MLRDSNVSSYISNDATSRESVTNQYNSSIVIFRNIKSSIVKKNRFYDRAEICGRD